MAERRVLSLAEDISVEVKISQRKSVEKMTHATF